MKPQGALACAIVALGIVACGSSDGGSSATTDGGAGTASGGSAGASTAGQGGGAGASGSAGAAGSAGAGGAAGAPTGCGTSLAAGTQTIKIQHDGAERSYILHVPAGYDASKPTPLVMNFHGLGSNAGQQEIFSMMDATADKDGFVVAYPEGVNNSWNAGTCCQSPVLTDDVSFTRAVVADIESRACIDPKRVYATGMSNGGFMSHRLGCEAADLFAAVAPVAGVLLIAAADCTPSRPMPLIDFHGTADPLVPYNGSSTMPSVPDTFKGWADRDVCTGSPVQTFQNGKATCMTYQTCEGGVEVTLCTITDEGHCWPGTAFCPTNLGAFSTDISANDEMWKFFQKFSLP